MTYNEILGEKYIAIKKDLKMKTCDSMARNQLPWNAPSSPPGTSLKGMLTHCLKTLFPYTSFPFEILK